MKKKLKRHFSAGGVVYRSEPEGVLWLIVKQSGDGKWHLPKGWIEPGESSMEAAKREVQEEGGVEAEILGKVGSEKYFFVQDKEKILKTVVFYLMEYIQECPSESSIEIEETAWLAYEEARRKLAFENEKELLDKANFLQRSSDLQPKLL